MYFLLAFQYFQSVTNHVPANRQAGLGPTVTQVYSLDQLTGCSQEKGEREETVKEEEGTGRYQPENTTSELGGTGKGCVHPHGCG